MRIATPGYTILQFPTKETMRALEEIGRNCYLSQDRITDDSWSSFIKARVDSKDGIPEHAVISVRIITNRATADALMRHRIASFATESTRYCNYSRGKFGKQVTFAMPWWMDGALGAYKSFDGASTNPDVYHWFRFMEQAEANYFEALRMGWNPDKARGILPLDVKCSCCATMNLNQWRYVASKRTRAHDDFAHPDMVRVMRPMFEEFAFRLPEVFWDCAPWQ